VTAKERVTAKEYLLEVTEFISKDINTQMLVGFTAALIFSVFGIFYLKTVAIAATCYAAGGFLFDNVSTAVCCYMTSPEKEANPFIRECMEKHGIIRGLLISHFYPKTLLVYFLFLGIGALVGGITFLISRYYVEPHLLLLLIPGIVFIGTLHLSAGVWNFANLCLSDEWAD